MTVSNAILAFMCGAFFSLIYDQVKVEKRLNHLESVTFGSSRCLK